MLRLTAILALVLGLLVALPATGFGQEAMCGEPRRDGELAVLGMTTPPVDQGTVTIPELGLTSPIENGCFEFRNITLPRDRMLVSFEVRADGYRPKTWGNYIILDAGSGGPNFTPTLEPGSVPIYVDYCADLLAANRYELSAAQGLHYALCLQLPPTGSGGGQDRPQAVATAGLLAMIGVTFVLGSAAVRLARR